LGHKRRGVLFIVSSPSGGGKTTLIKHAIERLQDDWGIPAHFSVSHTTRSPRPAASSPPRPGEVDGVDYHFVDRETFDGMVHDGQFLEWAEYAGNMYGTSRSEVEGRLEQGTDVFLDIEVQGANQVKSLISDVVKIFVFPPGYGVLKDRLMQRRQDSPEAIRQRLQWAMREFGVAGEFDYAIINDRLEQAVDVLLGICLAEHHRSERMKPRLEAIREDFQGALEEEFTP
jgi:guanylate kinase